MFSIFYSVSFNIAWEVGGLPTIRRMELSPKIGLSMLIVGTQAPPLRSGNLRSTTIDQMTEARNMIYVGFKMTRARRRQSQL